MYGCVKVCFGFFGVEIFRVEVGKIFELFLELLMFVEFFVGIEVEVVVFWFDYVVVSVGCDEVLYGSCGFVDCCD